MLSILNSKNLIQNLLLTSVVFAASFPSAADAPPKLVQQFLGKYCLECHNADVQ